MKLEKLKEQEELDKTINQEKQKRLLIEKLNLREVLFLFQE
jgi:hypothetical protein